MWNVRLYYHTHMNTVNTLDNGNKLETADYIDLPPVDILQAEGLSSVTVKATRAQVKNVEYVKLTDQVTGDFYYYEAGIPVATSADVQNIPLICDAFLTLADIYHGVENIPFLDGIITRHHVAKANDIYGAYTEEDPLLIPSKELDMDIVKLFDDSNDEKKVVVESTIALDTQANHYQAHVYTDQTSGNEVTVPTVVAVPQNSTATFGDPAALITYETAGTEYFDGTNPTVQEGISAVRGLGVESGILNSYVIPASHATFIPTQTGQIVTIMGVKDTDDSTMDFEYANVDNERVLYGSLNSIELISVASGMSASFKPEDLKDGETGDSPTVIKLTDPRPNGRPYYMFKYFKGTENEQTLKNAVAGMEWANAPLVYTGKSGSTLDQINLQTRQHIMNIEQSQAEYNNAMGGLRAFTGGASGAAQSGLQFGSAAMGYNSALAAQGNAAADYFKYGGGEFVRNGFSGAQAAANRAGIGAMSAGLGLFGSVLNGGLNIAEYFHNKDYLAESYNARMASELAQFATGQITAPALNFPRSETLRDFIGNGVFVVRYRPKQSDIEKLDKILTMYGYKDTIPIVGGQSVFNNRSKFNFVQIKGCTIGGDTPRWLREAAAAQLNAGVRIWHELPNRAAYNPGENV